MISSQAKGRHRCIETEIIIYLAERVFALGCASLPHAERALNFGENFSSEHWRALKYIYSIYMNLLSSLRQHRVPRDR